MNAHGKERGRKYNECSTREKSGGVVTVAGYVHLM